MKQILVIEDDPSVLEDIQEILSFNNFDVITAKNGTIGVQVAKAELPDLILCDVIMPVLDGFGVLKTLRQSSLTATIPIIFLTAKATREDIREGMELGADDYLTKPFTSLELLKTISARIEKQEAIKQANAAKLNDLRRNIASYLPHELLTPLHGIMGMTDLLSSYHSTMTANERSDAIAAIQTCSDRLNRLVQNFIIFSELEEKFASSQTWRNHPQNHDFEAIIGLVAYTCAAKVNRTKDLEVNVKDIPIRISSKHLTKLVEELVENAFKFSRMNSPVKLFSKVHHNFLNLYICDRGRGMTTEQIANIGAYMQFDRQHYEQQGNGLGLIISKRIIELYGGELSVESIIGIQTEVCIKFPID